MRPESFRTITNNKQEWLIWADIYVVFIGLSHFLSAKPIKPILFNNSVLLVNSKKLRTWDGNKNITKGP
jgi:hypothetical protein